MSNYHGGARRHSGPRDSRDSREGGRDRDSGRDSRGGYRGDRGDRRESSYSRGSRDSRDSREDSRGYSSESRGHSRGSYSSRSNDFNRGGDARKKRHTKSKLKAGNFNPSLDLIVSLLCKKQDVKTIEASVASLIDIKTFSKKIIVALDEGFHSEQEFFALSQKFANYQFIEVKKMPKANHLAVVQGCALQAKQYLFMDGDVEFREFSFEKLSSFLKANGKEYLAVSPRFYDAKGRTIKSCRRLPCVKWFLEHKKPSYKGSSVEKEFEMSERGVSGYLKVHSVNNPIMDCLLVDGEFLIKNKPLSQSYNSKLLSEASFAKKVQKAGRKIVYFPLARVVKHDEPQEPKASLGEMLKYALFNGVSFNFKKSS